MSRALLLSMVLAALVTGPPVSAGHAPTTHCSESGDVCASTKKMNGARLLRIGLAAEFFDEYTLCVTAPDDALRCKSFQIEDLGSTFGDSVRWKKHFPDKGPGPYTVRWKVGGSPVTPKLGFHAF